MTSPQTWPCAVCGKPTTYGGEKISRPQCTNCWEVEHRIQDYVKSDEGKKFLLKALNTIDVTPLKRWIGKEHARFNRIYEQSTGSSRERAFGEANVCELIIGKIDERLRTLKGQ